MTKTRVLIDVDGVLRNFDKSVRKCYKEIYPNHKLPDTTESWSLHKTYPIGQDIYKFVWEDHPFDIFAKAEEYEGSIDSLINWSNRYEIVITTSQPLSSLHPTLIWLGEKMVPTNEIHIVSEKYLVDGKFLLDDAPHNLKSFSKHGKVAVCMDRPWNQEWGGLRVYSIEGFFKLMEELS